MDRPALRNSFFDMGDREPARRCVSASGLVMLFDFDSTSDCLAGLRVLLVEDEPLIMIEGVLPTG